MKLAIIFSLLLGLMFYIIGAFVFASFNIACWDTFAKAFMSTMWVTITLGFAAYLHVK